MTVFLGLTGSIGMGKSTTADMFREFNIPVHDSDAVVHQLYADEAVPLIEKAFPGTTRNATVDRGELGKRVIGDDAEMKRLEAIIHPMVRQKEELFRSKVLKEAKPLAILDVPLLFETGGNKRVDGVIVVTAPYEVQKERVLSRPGMNEDKFLAILNRQVPDEEKRKMADFLIDTSLGMNAARESVKEIIERVNRGWKPNEAS